MDFKTEKGTGNGLTIFVKEIIKNPDNVEVTTKICVKVTKYSLCHIILLTIWNTINDDFPRR